MSTIRVGVLRGGPSSEYDVSLRTGQSVLAHLREQYQAQDILITKDGVWHWRGLPTTPDQIARQVDVFFNALHGEYGEDGKVQQLLDNLGVAYTGSGAVSSALGMNKALAKDLFRRAGLRVPPGVVIRREAAREAAPAAREVFETISPPWVVKPNDRGSSLGLFFVRTIKDL